MGLWSIEDFVNEQTREFKKFFHIDEEEQQQEQQEVVIPEDLPEIDIYNNFTNHTNATLMMEPVMFVEEDITKYCNKYPYLCKKMLTQDGDNEEIKKYEENEFNIICKSHPRFCNKLERSIRSHHQNHTKNHTNSTNSTFHHGYNRPSFGPGAQVRPAIYIYSNHTNYTNHTNSSSWGPRTSYNNFTNHTNSSNFGYPEFKNYTHHTKNET
jgi:hypothetical protein